MKLALASDVHGSWKELNYPPADTLVFAGDILSDYSRDIPLRVSRQTEEVERLNAFFGDLLAQGVYKYIVMVAGNHDFCFQYNPQTKYLLTNAAYLQDSEVTIQGIKFYGSPWQPWFYDWAFNFPCHDPSKGGNPHRAKAHAVACWGAIPNDTQVLVTHSPPLQILDETCAEENIGCHYLRERIDELKDLKLHVFGHAHYSHGLRSILRPNASCYNTLFVNAAIGDVGPKQPIQVVVI